MSWSIPIKTDHMLKESTHKPSMDYAKDIYKVASRLKDFIALEVGGAWGFSTLAILEAGAKHLTTVDHNTQIEAANEAKANGYINHAWSVTRSDKFWQENPNVRYDLVYIDGSHIYADVVNDLYEGWKRLNDNGLLLIDDWDHKKNIEIKEGKLEYGVSLACWEFLRDHTYSSMGLEGRILWVKK